MNNVFCNVSLSHRCIQTVLGGLLGNGSLKLQKNYRNARYQVRHSMKQLKYLEWKHKLLYEVALPKLQHQNSDGFSKEGKVGLQSKAHPELTKIHTVVCKNNVTKGELFAKQTNVLSIERNWLNSLDGLALLVWWLDDGSLIAGRKQGCFCTDSFTFEEISFLKQYLEEVWKIDCKISTVKERKVGTKPFYNRLFLNNTELRKLFHIIMPYLEVGTMINKFALSYNDFDYQQRWICTMKKTMPKEMHQYIDAWYKKAY